MAASRRVHMKLDELNAIVSRLTVRFPEADPGVIQQMVVSAEKVVTTYPDDEALAHIEGLCQAALRLVWEPVEFQEILRYLMATYADPADDLGRCQPETRSVGDGAGSAPHRS
jgi:hypothetical protein